MDFKTEHLLIGGVPAVLYGSQAAQGYLFLHGQMGCKEEAEAFAQVVCPKGGRCCPLTCPGQGARRGQGGELLPWTAVPGDPDGAGLGRPPLGFSLSAGQQHRGLPRHAGLGGPGPRAPGLTRPGHGGTDPDYDGLGWRDGGETSGTGRDPHFFRPDPVLGLPGLGAGAPGPHMALSHPHPLWEWGQHDARRTAEAYAGGTMQSSL